MQLNNYTQISNEFLECLPKYGESEIKIFLAISRKTIGWHKVSDKISYSQLKKMTGLATNSIKKGIDNLVKDGWITQIKGSNGFKYDLNMDVVSNNNISKNDTEVKKTISNFDTVKPETISNNDTVRQKTISNFDTTKEINIKKKYKEKIHTFNLEEMIQWANKELPNFDAEDYFYKYDSQGFIKAGGAPILNWKSHMRNLDKLKLHRKPKKYTLAPPKEKPIDNDPIPF